MTDDFSPLSDLLSPTIAWKNKEGAISLTMKRKGVKYGQLYYLFEIHWDRCSPSEIVNLNKAWSIIKLVSRQMKIPLYDVGQLSSELEKLKRKLDSLSIGETKDVSIPVLNHATGEVNSLTVGISKKLLKEKE